MKKTYYFSHDMNARNDEKILTLRSEYGWEGYGIYFALLEMLFETDDTKLNITNIKSIAFSLNIKEKKLTEIINFCIKIKLFEKDEKFFWSESLKRRKGIFERKIEQTRQAGIKSAEKRKEKRQQTLNENATNVEQTCNEKSTNKRKEKEIKENKIKEEEKEEKLQGVINEYENNIAPATAMTIEILQSYYEDLGQELIIEAIKRASLANKRSCKYIQGILNSWISKGFKTLIEVKNEEEEFRNKNSTKDTNKKGYSNYAQRDLDTIDFNKFYTNMLPGDKE